MSEITDQSAERQYATRHDITLLKTDITLLKTDINRLEDKLDRRMDRLDTKLWMILVAIVAALASLALKDIF